MIVVTFVDPPSLGVLRVIMIVSSGVGRAEGFLSVRCRLVVLGGLRGHGEERERALPLLQRR